MKEFSERDWALIESRIRMLGSRLSEQELRDWLALPETHAQLTEQHGEGYTLDDALDSLLGPRPKKRPQRYMPRDKSKDRKRVSLSGAERPYQAPKGKNAAEVGGGFEAFVPEEAYTGITQEQFMERVDGRLKEYRAHFKDIAPNDMALLRNLSYVEVNIEILNELMSREYAKSMPEGAAISRYTYALKGLSDQARNLQKDLHIDRATREKETARLSEVDEVMQVLDAEPIHVIVEAHAHASVEQLRHVLPGQLERFRQRG